MRPLRNTNTNTKTQTETQNPDRLIARDLDGLGARRDPACPRHRHSKVLAHPHWYSDWSSALVVLVLSGREWYRKGGSELGAKWVVTAVNCLFS